jgi:hypothetical protein
MELLSLTTEPGHRHNRIYLRRNPSRSSTFHLFNLLYRLLQTRCWLYFRRHYSQQKRLGLRIFEVHYSMDHQERIHSSHYDEHELDYPLVFDGYYFLVLRKDFQEVD